MSDFTGNGPAGKANHYCERVVIYSLLGTQEDVTGQ